MAFVKFHLTCKHRNFLERFGLNDIFSSRNFVDELYPVLTLNPKEAKVKLLFGTQVVSLVKF